MELKEAYKATKIVESLENFTVARDNVIVKTNEHEIDLRNPLYQDHADQAFWDFMLKAPESYWGKPFTLYDATLSDWIPRVPGLFFAKGSKAFRDTSKDYVALKSKKWTEFHPPGKSGKVLGGIGTFVLPQDSLGNRMMSVSHSCNSSTGIPVLISQDVWENKLLKPGNTLHIYNAKWEKLSIEWSQRFPSIKGIPRGCLVLTDINQKINKQSENIYPLEFHPFTIMEYESHNSLLYDYVYITVDTLEENYRAKMEDFFESYRNKDGRNGKYLIQIDMNNPLFDAIYNTPQELLKQNQYGESQLKLITTRLKNTYFGKNTITDLIDIICKHYILQEDLAALCIQANINFARIAGNTIAEKATVLLDYCIEKDTVEELIDAIAIQHSEIVK